MMCQNLGAKKLPLLDVGGGFSPYMVMHRTQPFKVPAELSDDEAILIEPLACAVHGVRKRMPEKGNRILVLGCGAIGLLTIAVAKAMQPDSEVIALARYPFQAEMARKLGAEGVIIGEKNPYKRIADLTGAKYFEGYFGNRILLGGFDIIYDTIGNDNSINDSLRWVRSRGSVVIIGINFKPGKIDYSPIWHQEITVTGINCHAMEEGGLSSFDMAAELLVNKRIPIDGMITHRFPMRSYREAIKAFFSKGEEKAIKIVLEHDG
jgi:threonine dehydrogenase-like Zn-dependent dehydrogenase